MKGAEPPHWQLSLHGTKSRRHIRSLCANHLLSSKVLDVYAPIISLNLSQCAANALANLVATFLSTPLSIALGAVTHPESQDAKGSFLPPLPSVADVMTRILS
mmetsp:Transcript_37116/g.84811  ORF Transcript_37116/g.84811 Transcript_37116/m.84811 type:complete len:103 (+) Transcript_37116:125-433(+)